MERINKIDLTKIYKSQYNQTPNSALKGPEIYPDVLGKNEKEYRVIVRILPYPNMAPGDAISINIGGLVYPLINKVDANDISNGLLVVFTQDQIKIYGTEENDSLDISYSITNYNYTDNNLSESSSISIIESVRDDLLAPSLKLNINDKPGGSFDVNTYSSVIEIPDFNKPKIPGKLSLYMMSGNNLLYSSRISIDMMQSGITNILISQSELAPYRTQELTVWYTISLGSGSNISYLRSVVSKIKIPSVIMHSPLEILNKDEFFKCLSSDTNTIKSNLNVVLKKYPQMAEDFVLIFISRYSDGNDKYPMIIFNINQNQIGDDIIIPVISVDDIKAKFASKGDLVIYYLINCTDRTSIIGGYTVIPY